MRMRVNKPRYLLRARPCEKRRDIFSEERRLKTNGPRLPRGFLLHDRANNGRVQFVPASGRDR